jgi:glycosyltransferase involved in cell wall biosynthesis
MTRLRNPKSIVVIVTDPSTLRILVPPQVRALRESGWEVSVICGRGDVSLLRFDQSVEFFQVNSLVRSINPIADFRCLIKLFKIVALKRPGAILASTPKASFLGLIIAFLLRVPRRIYQIRGARWETGDGFASKLLKSTDHLSLLLSTELLAVSPSLKKLYSEHFSLGKEITVLGRGSSKGVSLEIFYPPTDFILDTERPIFGFAGRLTLDKGVEDLLTIFKMLKVRFPEAKLEIAGSLDDTDPISKETLSLITESEDIHFYESIAHSELAMRMRTWSVQIFPSHREGLPNAIIEAAACGTPTIGWQIGGVLDALPAKYSDYALELGRFDQARTKVEQIIGDSSYLSIRSDFFTWARDNFSENKVQSDFIDYLELRGQSKNAN